MNFTFPASTKNTESKLRQKLRDSVLIADGAMGTMLQAENPTIEDFGGHDGCNEYLNLTRPDIVRKVHKAYLAVGVDAIETNTFGANYANLADYGIESEIYNLAKLGAEIAREAADEYSHIKPRFVLGSIGPGTKLPTLGNVEFDTLFASYQLTAKGLIDGGADALLIETTQDLLQAKAAVMAAREQIALQEKDIVLIAQVTMETTGTMLLGSDIAAAVNVLSELGVDLIGMNCATGPQEMYEHLRYLNQRAKVGISVMPNAGLPILENGGAKYPLLPEELANFLLDFTNNYGVNLIGGCCGTTPAHLAAVVQKISNHPAPHREIELEPGLSSIYHLTTYNQDNSILAIGERANANGSKAFREALLAEDWQACIDIAKDQIKDGAHVLDLAVDYVGRDGVRDMREIASRLATTSTLPIMLDSTEPAVIQAGLEHFAGRSILNSVNFEDGEGDNSRFHKIATLAKKHGAALVALTIDENGQARTAVDKVKIARRLIETLVRKYGIKIEDIFIDMLTFPISTGQEEVKKDGIETLTAIKTIKELYPNVKTTLGLSNISFGLNPAARVLLNSIFLDEARKVGLDSAIIHPSKITPAANIEEADRKLALDLIYDQRVIDENGITTYDPLTEMLKRFEGVELKNLKANRLTELANLPVEKRLAQRIIDGEKSGLTEDIEEALGAGFSGLTIINDFLLDGMKTVGELFGSGKMQLPFVLQSAEVMKDAVALLEPHLEKSETTDKGSILLATVKGDVHDIGKNLVDIILSNNGFRVVNIGIKQSINTIIDEAEKNNVDVIGLSGLLVKSTVIMKENLEEIANRKLESRWPIILGGAALTRPYVEDDLASFFPGTVRYAKDAFEGLSLMDTLMKIKNGDPDAKLPELRKRRTAVKEISADVDTTRSDIEIIKELPTPPFFGSRVVKGVVLKEYLEYLDERALFVGQWGLRAENGDFEKMAAEVGRPRLRELINEATANNWFNAGITYGYFPCYSEGNELVVLHHEGDLKGKERVRFSFPRQARDARLCISDFFAPKESGIIDVVSFHIVTMGNRISEATAELFAKNHYREYLELHGLSVSLTEALAEYWHARIREELKINTKDDPEMEKLIDQGYQGSRYSFGYPACPDLEPQVELLSLLQPAEIGVELSEGFQLHPEQSTSAIIVHHPAARYFNAR
jgi:5-methyltetrahydrofolate--homocysteine methyltransferase